MFKQWARGSAQKASAPEQTPSAAAAGESSPGSKAAATPGGASTAPPGEAAAEKLPALLVPSPPRKKQVLSPADRTELRTLLVGADLAKVTVGQVRQQLETRLGLEVGALATDRQKKELGRTLKYEVLRRLHGSEACEQIAKILMDSGRYPRTSCLMLLDALPAALVRCNGELHKHQLDVLAMARQALEDVRGQVLADAETIDARLAEANTEIQARGLQLERNWIATLQEGPLRALLDGTWKEDEERETALNAVQQRLVVLRTEESVMKSARKSLGARPAERGIFANQVNGVVERLLADRVAKIEYVLSAGLSASAKHDAAETITAHPAFAASAETFSGPMKRRAEATDEARKAREQIEKIDSALEALEKLSAGPPPAAETAAGAAAAPKQEEQAAEGAETADGAQKAMAPEAALEEGATAAEEAAGVLNGSTQGEQEEEAAGAGAPPRAEAEEALAVAPGHVGEKAQVVSDVDKMLAKIGAVDEEAVGTPVLPVQAPASPPVASPQRVQRSLGAGGQLLGGG